MPALDHYVAILRLRRLKNPKKKIFSKTIIISKNIKFGFFILTTFTSHHSLFYFELR